MRVRAFSLDTLGMPLGAKNITFTVMVPYAANALTLTSAGVSSSPTGAWTTVTNASSVTHIVVREGDFFYALIAIPEGRPESEWFDTAFVTATQNNKVTNMSKAQFLEITPATDSLTIANAKVSSLVAALKWLDTQ